MKKILIFTHGEAYIDFQKDGFLHRKYERNLGQKVIWYLISDYLNSQSENFYLIQKNLENADAFICDSDNTNLYGEIEKINFEETCFNDLIESLKAIKQKNPDLKIFIKNLPYTPKENIKKLSLYGKIINSWFDMKVIADLK